jgi:hypothetical protein
MVDVVLEFTLDRLTMWLPLVVHESVAKKTVLMNSLCCGVGGGFCRL